MKLYKFFRGVFSSMVTGQEPVSKKVKTKEWTWTIDCEHKMRVPCVYSNLGISAIYTDGSGNAVTAVVKDGDPIGLGVIGHIVDVMVYLMDNKTKKVTSVLAVLAETGPNAVRVRFRAIDHMQPLEPELRQRLEDEVNASMDKCINKGGKA